MTGAHDPWTRAVLDAVPHPLLVIDARGGVHQINRAATAILGYADERELLGRDSHEALHALREDGTRYPAHECPIVRTAPGRTRPPGREVFMDRAGRPLHVTWNVSGLPQPEHKLLSFEHSERRLTSSWSAVRSFPSADDIRV